MTPVFPEGSEEAGGVPKGRVRLGYVGLGQGGGGGPGEGSTLD